MSVSRDEAKRLLISLLPPGSEQLYALENEDVIGGTLYGLAGALKEVLLDRVEQLQLELNPATMEEKIPDWESACGLTNTPVARFGTLAQRRNAVLAVLRTSGSFSFDDIRAIVQPYFLYAEPSKILIVETDRAALRTAHTYTNTTPIALGPGIGAEAKVAVGEDPRVSPAGAHLLANLTGFTGDIALTLVGPDGASANFPPGTLPSDSVTAVDFDLCASRFAGRRINGLWTLRAQAGGFALTVNSWGVFVEGLGVNYDNSVPRRAIGEGLGAAAFQFAVIADPAKLGPGYDLVGAARSLSRWKPAHTAGTVVVHSGVSGASYYAIPDTVSATPDAAIPGP